MIWGYAKGSDNDWGGDTQKDTITIGGGGYAK
jgi:hypothetical protein